MTTNLHTDEDQAGEDRSMSVEDFCAIENFSKSFYHGLKRKGLGPVETHIGRLIRITAAARAKWHERMRELQNTRQAQLEAARRREQTVEAAKRSVESRRRDKAAIASPSPTSRRRPRIAEARR
jgi:hypothetical protein